MKQSLVYFTIIFLVISCKKNSTEPSIVLDIRNERFICKNCKFDWIGVTTNYESNNPINYFYQEFALEDSYLGKIDNVGFNCLTKKMNTKDYLTKDKLLKHSTDIHLTYFVREGSIYYPKKFQGVIIKDTLFELQNEIID